MLNKQDLEETISIEDWKQVLKNEKLWNEPNDALYMWNPIIYETCALYDKRKNIYRSYSECVRRTLSYQIYGDGKAPTRDDFEKEVPDI